MISCPTCLSLPSPVRGGLGSLACRCGRLVVVGYDPGGVVAVFVPELRIDFRISACGTGLVSGCGLAAEYLPESLRRADGLRRVPDDMVDRVVELALSAALAEHVLGS